MRNKLPVAARIAMDPQLRGNVGVLSEDLANDLFAQQTLQGEFDRAIRVLHCQSGFR